ncbi:small Multidrug Resistance family protein [Synechococcus sp. BIOS-E4-1]|uniref:DMT family transporter n=1 Tax=Synechococcus sp. BIOS-E4-1 TaxID=1400864 RepID=UPI0016440C09|nr:multidrug efflux SMR transporter [Synechococcus sp. BIOS-E4-1]QNI53290.1 small Multidrug Resistance family protein [Synechococcus sp. BIOS-E4-1]
MGSPWLLLLLAITAEVIGTSCLKLSQGFSRPVPTLVVLSAYAISMTLMSRVVQVLPMGLTYALWSGIGIVAIVMIGLLLYHQVPTQGQLMGMALITAGVITVNLSGNHG